MEALTKIPLFSERLRYLMRTHGFYQASDLAARIEKSPPTVGKWLAGGNIKDEHARSLGEVFGVHWLVIKYGSEVLEAFRRLDSADKARESRDQDALLALSLSAGQFAPWVIELPAGAATLSPEALDLFKVKAGACLGTLECLFNQFTKEDRPRMRRLIADIAAGGREPCHTFHTTLADGRTMLTVGVVIYTNSIAEKLIAVSREFPTR